MLVNNAGKREESPVIDVEVVADEYTDAIMGDPAGTATSDQDQSQPEGHTAAIVGPLGPNGPAGSGLMSREDAVEAQHEMNRRAAARTRNLRRR